MLLLSYVRLTKILAVAMILFVVQVSYLLTANVFDWLTCLHLTIGVAFSSAGSLALNQYMERDLDAKMKRTLNRPLPAKKLSPLEAKMFGLCSMVGGYVYIFYFINGLCGIATIICGFSYLYLYTPLKIKSSLSTLAGSIPGAMLPIMGWLASKKTFYEFDDLNTPLIILLLALILFIWQIPHALIIAIRYHDDYQAAGMKQLPIVKGVAVTHRHVAFNLFLLFMVSVIPYLHQIISNLNYIFAMIVLHTWLLVQYYLFLNKKKKDPLRSFHRSLLIYLPLFLCLLLYYHYLENLNVI